MKNNFIQIIALGAAGVALLASCGGTREKSDNWAWLGFERAATAPILEPDSTARFLCPMRGDSVAWMESDVFNPAAAVKGDSIVVLFRAEDNSATGIGSRTSRIGYAPSADGVNFTYSTSPVLCLPGSP